MGDGERIADLIDRLLAADKTAVGTAQWRRISDGGEHRLAWPLLMGGEGSRAQLVTVYHLGTKPAAFAIGVYAPRAIFRLDFEPYGGHTNPLIWRPDGIPHRIAGSHVHMWQDNRRLCTAVTLPERLKYARPLPPNIKTFENAFRWFCGEAKIRLESGNVPDPPRPETLL